MLNKIYYFIKIFLLKSINENSFCIICFRRICGNFEPYFNSESI